MSSSCIPISTACTSPVPDGKMNLTVKNVTKSDVNVTQIISSATPLCFSVPASSSVCVQLDINSAWKVTQGNKVLYASLSPQQPQYTAVIDDYTPAPLATDKRKAIPDKYFFGIAAGFFIVAVLGYLSMKAKWKPTAAFTECLAVSSQQVCKTLHPQSSPHKTFLIIGVILTIITIVAWLLFKGPLGKTLSGEPKNTVNRDQCLARGVGWQFTEPSTNDGVSGFKLWLRKMRCRIGNSDGPCMCFNANDRFNCSTAAGTAGAPKGLKWQTDLANTNFNKNNKVLTAPPITGNICACCTNTKGDTCFDVRTDDPLNNPCSPFPPKK